jgi:molybdenum cofactor synthesis domain-containing protein
VITEIRTAILTVSDRSHMGQREDLSGRLLRTLVEAQGWHVVSTDVLPDEQTELAAFLLRVCEAGETDLILTTGGTGVAPRDVTPEATQAVIERFVPGLAEAIRAEGMKQNPHAMISRGVAGIRGRTLIINLSGSPRAVREQFAVIAPVLPHAAQLLHDDPASEQSHTP